MSTTPLKQKRKHPLADITDNDFGNRMRIPPAIVEQLKAQGKECRFVDAKSLITDGNMHPWGWEPFKADLNKSEDFSTVVQGVSPDGYVRRGTLVLAARPLALGDQHRGIIARKNAAYKNVQKKHAEELRSVAREGGVDNPDEVIVEGYDKD